MTISPKHVRLGDVLDIRDGTHDTPKYVEYGVPLITSKNLTDNGICFRNISYISESDHKEISKRSAVSKGDILYGMIGTIGRPTLVETDVQFSIKNVALFKLSNPEIDNRYFLYLLKSEEINKQISQESKGGTQKFVSLGALRGLKAAFPPLPEQRRIAAILDKADALRAKRRETIAKLDQLLQSVFLEMFGDPVTDPKGWPLKELWEICDPEDRLNYGVVQPGEDFFGGVPLVRVGDIDGGKISTSSIKTIDPAIEKAYGRSRLKGNELLISCVGSIGVVASVPEYAVGYNIARAITRVPLARPEHRAFVQECLRSPAVQRYFTEKTRTVSQPTLNVSFVKSALVICPPAPLIVKFCEISEAIERRRQEVALSADKAAELFLSLQSYAFSGKPC